MPVTELVLLTSGLLAYALVVGYWIARCFDAMQTSHPRFHGVPTWRRAVYDPTLVFLATLPVPVVILTAAVRSAMISA